uniref:Uncharacterized protein n=1 Tax=Triticum urartu TaxID=4572 RepID=A0A8R7USQ2_TRIUA
MASAGECHAWCSRLGRQRARRSRPRARRATMTSSATNNEVPKCIEDCRGIDYTICGI